MSVIDSGKCSAIIVSNISSDPSVCFPSGITNNHLLYLLKFDILLILFSFFFLFLLQVRKCLWIIFQATVYFAASS